MSDLTKNEYIEMLANMKKAADLHKRRRNTSNEEYFEKLNAIGVSLSEEKIITDYDRIRDLKALDDSYYEQFGAILDGTHEEQWINSDVTMLLADRIIPVHFDIQETGDPFFIDRAIDDIFNKGLKKAEQKEIEKIFHALIRFSKTRDHHTLSDVSELYDIPAAVQDLIRACHNRDMSFRSLIKEMYVCFEDTDPKLFPSVYKEFLKEKK